MADIIGWREWLGLPDLGIERIKAKVDTGARTSALHVWNLVVESGVARFTIHPVQRKSQPSIETSASVEDWRWVKSSSGHRQHRPVIVTTFQLGEHLWKGELTLTARDEMGFRLLLGRSAIARHFLVNPGKSYVRST